MDPQTYAIRFGYGLPAPDPAVALTGPDLTAEAWPGTSFAQIGPVLAAFRAAKTDKDEAGIKAGHRASDMLALRGAKAIFARAAGSEDPFRERLVAFWADHFTVAAKTRMDRALPSILIDEAIRPHVTGRFADMLRAVITHPVMLIYLNQEASYGPSSRKGMRLKKGLNENLARELLELHTLGVGASYSQTDVRELAELLTGLSVTSEGFDFDPRRAEPGPETVLGVTYGSEGLEPILQALDDLAARPETAAHIAGKLAVHFVSDTPDAGLVAALSGVFQNTGGDLLSVAKALLAHPVAAPAGAKARQPFDFMVAALRGLGIKPGHLVAMQPKVFNRLILAPLTAMGQPFQQAPGPDGWPEAAADWITPQGLAARIDWAMQVPQRLQRPLPDPRAFLAATLGSRAGEKLVWAVSAAESAQDGVGLVLASPEFNRR
ncbi:MAG: DUF1800 domain-containing protein [Rhodobacterales bacterium]|nr:DUF1800 domain-containing protein [Rhodobacterales bacterium]